MNKLGLIINILDKNRVPLSSKERSLMQKRVYPYYGAQGIIDYVDNYIFDGEYILVAEDGNNLKTLNESIVTYAKGKFWVNNHAHILGGNGKADLKYIYYLLQTMDLRGFITGSAQPKLTQDNLYNIPLSLPALHIQKKISSFLSSLDLKIDNNNQLISELESMAKTIYDYWFLQFDFPDENGRPYKSSGGKMVWNEELKRDIPEGWHNGTLKSLGNIIGGGTPSTNNEEYYTDNGISWITPKDLSETNNKFIRHGERDITQKGLSNSSAVLMPRGTVLMTSRAPIGYLGIASNEVCTNQGFKSILPKESYDSEFIYQTLNMLMPYIKQIGSGSTFAEVSKSDMEKINIIIPSVKIRVLFNNKIKSINELIENLENENKELASLRDFLLPMLMNGQVTFKEL